MARIAEVTAETANDEQRRLGAEIFAIRGGRYSGPYAHLLHSPVLAEKAKEFGTYLRNDTSLPKRLSELVIAATARHWRCQFEWSVHRHQALAAGIEETILEAVRLGHPPSFTHEDEAAVYAFVSELYAAGSVSKETQDRLQVFVGDVGLIEIVSIAGYYSFLALICNAFEPTITRNVPPLV